MRILAAADIRDREAEQVIDSASAMAARVGGTVDLLWVNDHREDVQVRDPHLKQEVQVAARANAEARLRDLLARVPHAHRGQAIIRDGKPGEEVIAEASTHDAVVLARRRHTALETALMGSVAQTVARGCTKPVLLLPEGRGVPAPGEPLAAMFGVDLRASDAGVALQAAARWIGSLGGRLDLAHVDDAQLHIPFILDPDVRATAQHEWDAQRAADVAALTRLIEHIPTEIAGTPRLADGKPADGLAELGADYALIVVATHGRTGLARWWLGSVGEALLTQTRTPVLLLRAEDR